MKIEAEITTRAIHQLNAEGITTIEQEGDVFQLRVDGDGWITRVIIDQITGQVIGVHTKTFPKES